MSIIVFLLLLGGLVAPKATTYGCAVPILGFTFGGFAWAVGGLLGAPWAQLSLLSFLGHILVAAAATLFAVSRG